jgi:translation initiation factor 2B subunit (eIF-2B alpha/beta/delta family)
MHESVMREIEAIRQDHRSGATALLRRGLGALARAGETGPEALGAAALELWRAQPSMAAFRTAAAVMLAAPDRLAALERFARRVERAPALIARYATALLGTRRSTGPLRLVTCSRSGCVEAAIVAVASTTDVIVACAEGRPALEGRQLAAALVARDVRVELFSDAAVGVALPGADALLVGADALSERAFINKVGTGALAALAATCGTPAYVLAATEKIVPREVFSAMHRSAGSPAELWADAPPRVSVINPYFEEVALGLAAAVVTEAGVLGSDEVAKASQWPKQINEYERLI